MATKPTELKTAAPSAVPPPPPPLPAGQVGKIADGLESAIDEWLDGPDVRPPCVVPYLVRRPEVIAELQRRYETAGWSVSVQSGIRLILFKPAVAAVDPPSAPATIAPSPAPTAK